MRGKLIVLNYINNGLQRIVAMTKSKNLTNKKILMLGTALVSLNTLGSTELKATTGAISALATIVDAITVSSVQALNFGRFVVTASGTITVDTAGADSRTGGLTDASGAGVIQEGIFKIGGTASVPIDVTISATNNLTGPGTILLGSIDLNTIAGVQASRVGTQAISLPVGGTATFPMGGTITVDAADPVGEYTGSVILNAVYQ